MGMSNKSKQGGKKKAEPQDGEEFVVHIDEDRFEGCEAEDVVEYTKLVTANAASAQELARQGIALSSQGMLQKRLEMLIDLAFDGEKQARLNFEIAFQRDLRKSYDEAEVGARRMRLMGMGSAPSGGPIGGKQLIVPGVTE
jgi:hypothetical protein